MYQPIPGYVHLRTFVPADPIVYADQPAELDPQLRKTAADLVIIMLEVAAGHRPPNQLGSHRFAATVSMQLRMWSKRHGTHLKPVAFALLSFHGRDNGEFFGTASLGGKQYAFIATFDGGRVQTFRLL